MVEISREGGGRGERWGGRMDGSLLDSHICSAWGYQFCAALKSRRWLIHQSKDCGSQDLNNARFKSNGQLGGVAQKRVELCQAISSNTQGWSRKVSASKAVPANTQVWSWTEEGAAPSCPLEQSKVELHRRGWS